MLKLLSKLIVQWEGIIEIKPGVGTGSDQVRNEWTKKLVVEANFVKVEVEPR